MDCSRDGILGDFGRTNDEGLPSEGGCGSIITLPAEGGWMITRLCRRAVSYNNEEEDIH